MKYSEKDWQNAMAIIDYLLGHYQDLDWERSTTDNYYWASVNYHDLSIRVSRNKEGASHADGIEFTTVYDNTPITLEVRRRDSDKAAELIDKVCSPALCTDPGKHILSYALQEIVSEINKHKKN